MKRLSIGILMAVLTAFILVPQARAGDISLKWDAVTGATGYKVYKSEDIGTTWSPPIDAGNVTAYTYLGVIDTGLVLFRLAAYNANGEYIRVWSGAWYDGRKKPLMTPGGAGIP